VNEPAASERTVGLPGGSLRAIDRGEGPVVLLLHGLGAGPDLWRDVLPDRAHRMRVVVPDLTRQAPSDPKAIAGRVSLLLDELAVDECAIVGHGLGGVVAQWLALRANVRCLVLIDAGPADPSGGDLRADAPEPSVLQALDIPALVLWGEDDPFVGVEIADGLADALPQSTLVLLPGCGHFLPTEAPETVATLIGEFLRFRYLGLPHQHDHARPMGPVPVELRRGHGPA
jgi:pimeloyl-ACP methyl ester carboxylesterase